MSTATEVQSEGEFVLIGLDDRSRGLVQDLLKGIKTREIKTSKDFESLCDTFIIPAGSTVLVGPSLEGMSYMEVGQAANSIWTGLRLIFITDDRNHFQLTDLKKNGFQEVVLLPADKSILESEVLEAKNTQKGLKKRYRAVKVVDMDPTDDPDFDLRVYLPLNQKYIPIKSKGQTLSDKKFAKLQEQAINSLYVENDDLEKFYEFTASKLAKLGDPNKLASETETAAKAQKAVRTLFQSILDASKGPADFEEGRDLLEQSHRVVQSYVKAKTNIDLRQQIQRLMGEARDTYAHAQSVSTIASLLSLALNIGKPEDLAIAGLFHDIGILGFPDDVTPLNFREKLSPEDQKKFELHPEISIKMLKEKRITVSPEISEMIEKHHERADGKGYPRALPPHKVPLEAQLLSFSDMFEYLTRPVSGKPTRTPIEAIDEIAKIGGLSPEILVKARKFFLSES